MMQGNIFDVSSHQKAKIVKGGSVKAKIVKGACSTIKSPVFALKFPSPNRASINWKHPC